MAAPSISSQQLDDYAITTEETTTASCSVSNTPSQVLVYVNGLAYALSNTTGTTYSKILKGTEIGLVTTGTVRFVATNADGGDQEDAGSTLTVSAPTLPKAVEVEIAERLIQKFNELDTTNEAFKSIKTKSYAPPRPEDWSNSNLFPYLWIKFKGANIEHDHVGDGTDLRFNPLEIELEFHRTNIRKADFDWFFNMRRNLTRMQERDPDLKLSDEYFIVEDFEITRVRYPDRIGDILIPAMIITLSMVVSLENV
jgi:hypothetical protein